MMLGNCKRQIVNDFIHISENLIVNFFLWNILQIPSNFSIQSVLEAFNVQFYTSFFKSSDYL